MYFNEHKHSLKTYLLFENIKARLYKNNIQLKKKKFMKLSHICYTIVFRRLLPNSTSNYMKT